MQFVNAVCGVHFVQRCIYNTRYTLPIYMCLCILVEDISVVFTFWNGETMLAIKVFIIMQKEKYKTDCYSTVIAHIHC